MIFGGDEDFTAGYESELQFDGVSYRFSTAEFGPSYTELAGAVVWTGGLGCEVADIPPGSSDKVALIQRGTCYFQTKTLNAQAQGYGGVIIANVEDELVTMAALDDTPVDIPAIFVDFSTGEAMKAGGFVDIVLSDVYYGAGYLHVINNSGQTKTVPVGPMLEGATQNVPHMGELGYYAPKQTVEPGYPPSVYGDTSMHNIVADPLTANVSPTLQAGPRMFISWYSLGMRASK